MAMLGAYAKRFEADLRNQNDTAALRFRMRILWPDENAVAARGCGFYIKAGSDANGSDVMGFPAYREHRCDNGAETYMMRTTSAADSPTYDVRMPLPDRPQWVEVHADGYRRTYVEVMCVGLYVQEVAAYRSVCVNRALLNECAVLTDQSVYAYRDTAEIPMSKARPGIQILVFQFFNSVFGGFRNMTRDASDIVSRYNVCNGIDWIRGQSYGTGYCHAERVSDIKKNGEATLPSVAMNPDRCVPVS